MKQSKLLFALAALPVVITGCDIFKPDALDPPGIMLTGQVVANGKPVPVRTPSGTTQLRLWQTDWEADDPDRQPEQIGIHLKMDGTFSAAVYPGEYDIQLIENQGPWVNDTTRIPIVVNGDMNVNIPVRPYFTIEDESIVFTAPAAGDTTGGRITATFRVAQHEATGPALDLVGLYVSTATFVDRGRRHTGGVAGQPSALRGAHERTRTEIQTQLTNNQPITITLTLPSDIRLTRSPDLRTTLWARVGVKPVGVTELAYSEVVPVNISIPQ